MTATYINTKVFSDAPAMLSQHTERHAFFQKDAYFILILQLHLEMEMKIVSKSNFTRLCIILYNSYATFSR